MHSSWTYPWSCLNKIQQVCYLLPSFSSFIPIEALITGLGKTVDELDLSQLGSLHHKTIEKTLFSMVTPAMSDLLQSAEHANVKSILLTGIEVSPSLSHVINDHTKLF